MDGLIKRFDAIKDNDLMICQSRGVAYQRDMSKPFNYAEAYWQHYVDIEGGEIAKKINAGRVALVNDHIGAMQTVLDVGIGSGEFIKNRPNTFGTDVNRIALDWLKKQKKLGEIDKFSAFTFWDVLEHIAEPNRQYFRHMPDNCFLFTCLPVFTDLTKIRKSKHYKPDEHLYYWSEDGFVSWMAEYRFRLLDLRKFETEAGRESITSFAFKRDLPGYHETVDQYRKMYEPNYGMSAYLYFDRIAEEVKTLNPGSVLDYGCGHSDLVAHFWLDGRRKIAKYDPAIPQFKEMPEGEFGLVICCDVMEHIRMTDIDRILGEIRAKSKNVIFTISMKPARAKLPDGRNAHVSLLSVSEWTRCITEKFGNAARIPVHDDQILMLKTFG